MKFSVHTVAAALMLAHSEAFIPSSKSVANLASDTSLRVQRGTSLKLSFLDQLPNPFETNSDDADVVPRPPSTPPPVTNEPEALFSRARAILANDLGISDPSFLAEDFKWIGPNVVSTGKLSKEEYLAAGRFFNLRGSFPDLDYRAHDFRLDPDDPLTVRCTARTVGTMRGELRLRSETMPPNGVRMVCPPEAVSMTFDKKTGKLVKLCSGFTMDRLVGNTGGLCGVMAAATVAGSPPSEWELYPPATVVTRFFARSVKQLKEPAKIFLAPFPETVMIQLTKGVLAAELGTKDPDLLAGGFTFCGPIVGPLNKKTFLDAFSNFNIRDALPDLDENYSNFRVDPYDPYRVWYDIKAKGTRTGPLAGQEGNGAKYFGPPEVGSMTFDDDGFCTRLTAGAVMDPTYGNTGGLGGVFGIFYATGVPLPALTTRPLPQILNRAQKAVLSPITGQAIDDFIGVDEKPAPTPAVVNKVVDAPKPPEAKTFVLEKAPVAETPKPVAKAPVAPVPPAPEKPKVKPVPKKNTSSIAILEEPADPVSDIFSNLFGAKAEGSKADKAPSKEETKPKPAAKTQPVVKKEPPVKTEDVVAKQKAVLRAAAEQRKKEAEEKKATLAENAKQEAESKQAALAEKQKAAEEKRLLAIAANEAKKREVEEKKAAAVKAASNIVSKAKKGATISLGFLNFGNRAEEEPAQSSSAPSKAPRGVPTISKWYENDDGSISGQISGSAAFRDGETITTSPIKTKTGRDTVVVTVSGSKYFLDDNVGSAPLFNFFAPAKKAESAPAKAADDVAEKRKQALEEKKAQLEAKKLEAQQKREAALAFAEEKKAQLEAKKLEAQQNKETALAAMKEKAEKAKAAATSAQKKVDPKAASLLAGKKTSGTISLGSEGSIFGFGAAKGKTKTGGPSGVPVINKFKQNRDGSVTGFITGSNNFKEGEKVTTSKLAPNQKVESGNVVVTESGSKYFIQ